MTDSKPTPLSEEELKRLIVRIAGQCVRREYCSAEIRTRLDRRGLPAAQIRIVLHELARRQFIDDSRYAGAFVRTKLRAGWGVRKITYALRIKQLPAQIIADALAENSDPGDYIATALKAARTKARRLDLTTHADYVRLYRFLASRGYEADVISKVLRTLRAEL